MGSLMAADGFLVNALAADPKGRPGRAPVFDQQPPRATTFEIGVPASIPYGKGHHPDGRALTAGLDALPAGFSVSLIGDEIILHWDGQGVPGLFEVRAFLDDAT
jgi:hypothetical protein